MSLAIPQVTGNQTIDTLLAILGYADVAADIALPLAGQAELVPLIDAVNALAQKVAQAAAQKGPTVAAEVAAADAAFKASELAAGLK